MQPRGEGELIELSDDEAVAAAVMLPMVAADRRAPSASSHTGGAFKRNARGSSEAILGTAAAIARGPPDSCVVGRSAARLPSWGFCLCERCLGGARFGKTIR